MNARADRSSGLARAELDRLADEIATSGGEAEALDGDVRDEAHARALAETAMSRFGRLDIGFNNAGIFAGAGPSSEVPLDAWRDVLDINLTGPFLCARHQIAPMVASGGGSIIFTSAYVGASIGFPGTSAYAASKAGLSGLAKSLAVELGPQGIRVNALVPGAVDTAGYREKITSPEQEAFFAGLHALKRVATAEEFARMALVLASDDAAFVTGSTLHADGGVAVARG